MSETIELRRDGDDWIIDDGSARIRLTTPGAGIIERFVDQWDAESHSRRNATRSVSPERPERPKGVS
ncbi:hypothetical protein AB4Z10_27220 [Bosea sp. RAF48]|uniref:hypothetical protein n=1 Tax=Bosea sp. RAF48 TaxID=3237480 RepID=UPI003F8F0805